MRYFDFNIYDLFKSKSQNQFLSDSIKILIVYWLVNYSSENSSSDLPLFSELWYWFLKRIEDIYIKLSLLGFKKFSEDLFWKIVQFEELTNKNKGYRIY